MTTACIRVDHLCLDVPSFVQREHAATSWVRTLLGAATARPKRQFRRLLNEISFTLNDGDRLALIGSNGAGKTTLLRVLTGAYAPTHGTLQVAGTRQALLNIGLGFNKEATLMENIFLRGTAMGIAGKDLRQLAGSMLEFAGLAHKAQDRLYTLSAGQRARLGFAIATATRRDIVLMDEWLGAGDAAFVERAKQRMQDRVSGSKIVVLASHNTSIVKEICNKGMVLEGGRIRYLGEVDDALKQYAVIVKEAKAARQRASEAALDSDEREQAEAVAKQHAGTKESKSRSESASAQGR